MENVAVRTKINASFYRLLGLITHFQPIRSTVDLKIATDYRPESPFYFLVAFCQSENKRA